MPNHYWVNGKKDKGNIVDNWKELVGYQKLEAHDSVPEGDNK